VIRPDLAAVSGIDQPQGRALHDPNQVTFFRIGKDFQVPHASVVLAERAYGHSGSPMEPANLF
jgi:hypothetical protein